MCDICVKDTKKTKIDETCHARNHDVFLIAQNLKYFELRLMREKIEAIEQMGDRR